MKLRWRTLLAVASTLIGLNILLYLVSSNVLLSRARISEERRTEEALQSALNFITNLQNNFHKSWLGWSQWDDSYRFVQAKKQDYISANFADKTFQNLEVNLIIFADTKGKIFYQVAYDLEQAQRKKVPPAITERLKVGDLLFPAGAAAKSHKTGFLLLPEGVLLISAQPITDNEAKKPIAGTVIFGRFLTSKVIQQSAESFNIPLKIYRIDGKDLPPEAQEAKQLILQESADSTQRDTVFKPLNSETISGYAPVTGIDGKAVILIQVDRRRFAFQRATENIRYFNWITSGVGVVFGIVTILLIEKLVLARLSTLNENVNQITQQGDLSRRMKVSGRDELAQLTISFNQMLTALEEHQQQEEQRKAELQKAKEIAEKAQEKTEQLLLNILPQPIAEQLKQRPDSIAEYFENATILFSDIVGFTAFSANLHPNELVNFLNQVFSAFDALVEKYQLEKIKTIGDAYMVVAGLPIPRSDHAFAIANMALEMQEVVAQFSRQGTPFQVRIGINTGAVVAGVIGKKKFIYDLWGDTVNVASRMESHGKPNCIQVTVETYEQLKEHYVLEPRGVIAVKGRDQMETYWLLGKRS